MLTFRFLSANPLKHPLLKREKANLPYFFRRSLKKGFTRVILRVSCSLTRFIQPPSGEKYFHFTTLIILKLPKKSKSRHHQPQTHTENASGSQPIFEATDESETGSVIQHDSRTTSLADLDSVLPSEISSQRSQELALHQERPASLEITEESKEISSPVLTR